MARLPERQPIRKLHIKKADGVYIPPETIDVVGGSDMPNIVVGGDNLLRSRRKREEEIREEEFARNLPANQEIVRKYLETLMNKETPPNKA